MPVTAQQHGDGVGGVSADSVSHDAGSEKRQTATAAACLVTSSLDAGGAGVSAPQTLFLELGWQLHPRVPPRDDDDDDDGQGNIDDDGDEPPTVEFALTLHNLKVCRLSGCTAFSGFWQGHPDCRCQADNPGMHSTPITYTLFWYMCVGAQAG